MSMLSGTRMESLEPRFVVGGRGADDFFTGVPAPDLSGRYIGGASALRLELPLLLSKVTIGLLLAWKFTC